jgi:hypothetical protein
MNMIFNMYVQHFGNNKILFKSKKVIDTLAVDEIKMPCPIFNSIFAVVRPIF